MLICPSPTLKTATKIFRFHMPYFSGLFSHIEMGLPTGILLLAVVLLTAARASSSGGMPEIGGNQGILKTNPFGDLAYNDSLRRITTVIHRLIYICLRNNLAQ